VKLFNFVCFFVAKKLLIFFVSPIRVFVVGNSHMDIFSLVEFLNEFIFDLELVQSFDKFFSFVVVLVVLSKVLDKLLPYVYFISKC
jgi:hypothetical protein